MNINDLCQFKLFKNTPLIDMQNTIHFNSNEERDSFFLSRFERKEFESFFNFRKDRGVLQVPLVFEDLIGYNYGVFYSIKEKRNIYFFIVGNTYLNPKVTRLDIVIDVVMTFTQGNVLNNIGQVEVIREHLDQNDYNRYFNVLKNNSDVLQCNTKMYKYSKSKLFTDLSVIVLCSADLTSDFGTTKEPTLVTSSGGVFDGCTSMMNMYLVKQSNFTSFNSHIASYPWIAQNIQTSYLIPTDFIDFSNFEKVEFKNSKEVEFFKSKNFKKSKDVEPLTYSYEELINSIGLKEHQKHVFKNGYFTIELTDFKGNVISYEPSKIYNNLEFKFKHVIGYYNEIKVYLKGYSSFNNSDASSSYLNLALTFSDFNKMPTLIDNGSLSYAKSSYNRELQNSKTISGRLNQIKNGSTKDKIFNSLTVFSDVFSGNVLGSASKVANLYNDEYEYYRQQQADLKELALTPISQTEASYGNSLLIKENKWGVHLLISTPQEEELSNILNYYELYGDDLQNSYKELSPVNNRTVCNWIQFKGNWNLTNVDVDVMNVLRSLFEGGVRFWHNSNNIKIINSNINANRWR